MAPARSQTVNENNTRPLFRRSLRKKEDAALALPSAGHKPPLPCSGLRPAPVEMSRATRVSADEAQPLLAVGPAPVLDDLAVTDAQDRRAIDLDRLAGRADAVEGRSGVGASYRPIGHDEASPAL